MTDMSSLTFALLVGVLLGAIFYGGLWWTVRSIVSSRRVSIWLIGSFLGRTIIAVGGFYIVSQGAWRSLLACLIGFFLARLCVGWLTRSPLDKKARFVTGTGP
jgi:F1F0 ATPase subunit 2